MHGNNPSPKGGISSMIKGGSSGEGRDLSLSLSLLHEKGGDPQKDKTALSSGKGDGESEGRDPGQ